MLKSKIKTQHFMFKFIIIYIVLFVPLATSAQSGIDSLKTDSSLSIKSRYSLGIIGGYTGLLIRSKSTLTGDVSGTSIVNGGSLGFIFEYGIGSGKSAIQFLSETNYLNFKRNGNDNFENISFNLIGVKLKFNELAMLYFLPAVGIMSGKETQFIRSFGFGFDFNIEKKRNYIVQLSVAETDMQDVFLMAKLGILFNL